MIVLYIILGLLIFGLFVFFVFQFDSLFGKLDFTTSRLAERKITEIIKNQKLEAGWLYDLGSCRGSFDIRLAKDLPGFKVLGIDDSRFRVWAAKIRGMLLKNLSFIKQNLFKANLSPADVVYVYLPQEMMAELGNKLQKELKPEAIVITNRIFFPNWKPAEIHYVEPDNLKSDKIFVYKKFNN